MQRNQPEAKEETAVVLYNPNNTYIRLVQLFYKTNTTVQAGITYELADAVGGLHNPLGLFNSLLGSTHKKIKDGIMEIQIYTHQMQTILFMPPITEATKNRLENWFDQRKSDYLYILHSKEEFKFKIYEEICQNLLDYSFSNNVIKIILEYCGTNLDEYYQESLQNSHNHKIR